MITYRLHKKTMKQIRMQILERCMKVNVMITHNMLKKKVNEQRRGFGDYLPPTQKNIEYIDT